MENIREHRKRTFLYAGVILLVFVFQQASLRAGSLILDMFSYGRIDPDNAFAGLFVHHTVILIIALVLILILGRLLKADFCLGFGDSKKGVRYVAIYTAVLAVISLAVHVFMLKTDSLPVYSYPLNKRNVLGTLSFQLLLTGPAEEMLFRALPVTVFAYVAGDSAKAKRDITPENIIAALLFSLAHIKWTVSPFSINPDYYQLVYAFAQGLISGKAYQDCRSIVYPMCMHSLSNVLMVGTGYLFLSL